MVTLDDMQEVLKFLNDIENFFKKFDDTNKKLQTDLYNKEGERDDLLHEVELSKLNAMERAKVYAQLEKVLKERRIIKDKIDLMSTIKSYCDEYIKKRNLRRNKNSYKKY